MSPALQSLLLDIRQHPAFEEMKRAVEMPRLPRYRPSKSENMGVMGAKTIFESGRLAQHEAWLIFLTGSAITSEQERS